MNISTGIAVVGIALIAWMLAWSFPEKFFVKRKRKGNYVAEVWLDWSFGRGATLYRQRFHTRRGAYLAVRIRAFMLDCVLPTHYVAEDWSGRRYLEQHEYGITWGVRQVAAGEDACFQHIWSPSLPGDSAFSGEHASVHPLLKDLEDALQDGLSTEHRLKL